jgi:hypothetical protein
MQNFHQDFGIQTLSFRLYEVSIRKWYSTGGVPLCERSLPQCKCSLLVSNATMVVADMSTC